VGIALEPFDTLFFGSNEIRAISLRLPVQGLRTERTNR
jgi:hypothetical protein